jgi:hypothetical protein
MVSTTVRDRDGNVLIKIRNNCWQTAEKPIVWDKNYTADSIEVLNREDVSVFRIRLLRDRAVVEGEWYVRDTSNQTGQRSRVFVATRNLHEPVFLYPSSEHWGEYAKRG